MELNQTLEKLVNIKKELLKEINKLHIRYMKKYIESVSIAFDDDYELDAKSYIILCHAALENFVECLAEILIDHSKHIFVNQKKINHVLLSFCIFRNVDTKENAEDDWGPQSRELIIPHLKEAINAFKEHLNQSNHGIKIKNLKEILRPVGIDVRASKPLLISLEKLTNLRGKFAHRFMEKGSYVRANKPEGPETICKAVMDVITLFMLMHNASLKQLELTLLTDDVFKKVLLKDLLLNMRHITPYTGTSPLKPII